MPDPETPPPEPSVQTPSGGRLGCIWSAVLLFLVIGGAVGTGVYLFVFRAPVAVMNAGVDTAERSYALARKVAKDVIRALQFQPQIKIGDEIVYEQTKGILELATVERRFTLSYVWENSWLGSRKELELKGQFIAKAGYDLTQPFNVEIGTDGRTVHASVPPAKVLSVELLSHRIVQDQDGYWNALNARDREQAMNALLALARSRVEESNLKASADAELAKRLQTAADQQNPLRVAVTLSKSAQ